ncbi:unnamed protein product [Rotaria sp. Silwood1]|nr:unnamed protein product [Rotaria sp. Silwood1]
MILGPEQAPSIATLLNQQNYEGRLTTSGTAAVAAHIRSFYRALAIIMILLLMMAIGALTIIFGHFKKDSCPATPGLPKVITTFGVLDIIICGIMIPIVRILIFSFSCSDHQNLILRSFYRLVNLPSYLAR